MIPRMQILLGVLVFLLLPAGYCFAGEEEPIVWFADGVSINGIRQVELSATSRDTVTRYEPGIVASVVNSIKAELTSAGIDVNPAGAQKTGRVRLQISLVHYQPGSVGGRWIGMGGGAAVCIVRAFILDAISGVQIGDIIVAEQVGSGGLFSIGAEKHILERAAHRVAGELATLLGVDLEAEEVSG